MMEDGKPALVEVAAEARRDRAGTSKDGRGRGDQAHLSLH
jgi:hypothetical protein